MKLTAFRIYRYKSILDSGWIEVSPLTVLVGKNESGKTTVLKALHKLNPFDPEPYLLDREWPRSQRKGRSDSQVVCAGRFALSAGESAELQALTGAALAELTVTRDYRGRLDVAFPDDLFPGKFHPNAVDALCDKLPQPVEPVSDSFREQVRRCHAETRRLAAEGRFTQLSALAGAHLEALKTAANPWNPPPNDENELACIEAYAARLAEIAAAVETLANPQTAAHEYVAQHLPAFLFMDEYRTFRGSASLKETLWRKQHGALTGEDRTLEMILELSGLDLASEAGKAENEDREQRQYDLDDAAVTLTRAIQGRWKQLRYEVKFAADGAQFFTFVKDEKDGALIKLEERSRGFQWFFSFDLMLMYESKGQFKDCVILLDEPGLYLHPDAQRDLLKRLEEYAGSNTLLYSTHLPFMVDLEKPERIRVLNETQEGAVVTSDLTGCQPEAKFTLDAALGIAASSSFLMARRNLIVEGEHACEMLREISNLFIRSGLEGLPEDVSLTPAADAAQAAYIATLMVGRGLEVVALLAGTGRDNLVDRWVKRYNSAVAAETLMLGPLRLEEILPRRASRKLAPAQVRSSLVRMRTVDELPPETRAAAEKALRTVSALFGKEKQFWSQTA